MVTSFQSLFVVLTTTLCLTVHPNNSYGSVMAFQSLSHHHHHHHHHHARSLLLLPITTTTTSSNSAGIFLHPDQAADLEACAYDLMKEALEEVSSSGQSMILAEAGESVNPNTMESSSSSSSSSTGSLIMGPVSWCRRRLWPFSTRGGGTTTTMEQQQQNLLP